MVDAATVQAGGRAYSERGCVNCHGGPGVEWAKFSEGLHPDPPDLKEIVNDRSPRELFWIISNGKGKMLGEGDRTSEKIRWNFVNLVRSFGKKGARDKPKTENPQN